MCLHSPFSRQTHCSEVFWIPTCQQQRKKWVTLPLYSHHRVVEHLVLRVATLARRLLLFTSSAVDVLLEDWLRLIDLELGLEVLQVGRDAAAVGSAAGIDKGKLFLVHNFASGRTPIGLSTSILLCLLGVSVGKAVLAKELGDVRLRVAASGCTTLNKGRVILVVVLVGASHCYGFFRKSKSWKVCCC